MAIPKFTGDIIKQLRKGKPRSLRSRPYSPIPQCRLPQKLRIDTQQLRKLLKQLKRK